MQVLLDVPEKAKVVKEMSASCSYQVQTEEEFKRRALPVASNGMAKPAKKKVAKRKPSAKK